MENENENKTTEHADSSAAKSNPRQKHEHAHERARAIEQNVRTAGGHIEEELETEKQRLRKRANTRVSHICVVAALVITAIGLGSVALGHADMQNVLVGQLISVMLICVAYLQDHHIDKS